MASDGEFADYFGGSVSISGDAAVIGAYTDDDNGYNAGSAYLFHFDGNTWVEQTKLLSSDGAAGDKFGRSASISGGTAIIGAYRDDNDFGSTYLFNQLAPVAPVPSMGLLGLLVLSISLGFSAFKKNRF
jgi:hypothetical protein